MDFAMKGLGASKIFVSRAFRSIKIFESNSVMRQNVAEPTKILKLPSASFDDTKAREVKTIIFNKSDLRSVIFQK
jgi:hypothetical protein